MPNTPMTPQHDIDDETYNQQAAYSVGKFSSGNTKQAPKRYSSLVY